MRARFYVFFLAILLGAPSLYATPEPLRIEAASVFHRADLLPHTAYIVDTDGDIMVEDLPLMYLTPVNGRGVFIFNKDVYWIQFQIDNRLSETRPLTLMHAQSYLDRVDLFEWKDGRAERLMLRGDRVPDPAREFCNALFPLHVTPGLHTYYARIQTDGPMNLQFYAWEPQPIQESIGDIQTLFFHKIFKDVGEVFQDLSGCLPLLAKDLHKEIPEVEVETGGILFGERAEELFRNIFVHILRNSMDHGLESARERLDAGKSAKGRLMITMKRLNENLVLRYSDDGRGLNLTRIAEAGVARGILTPDTAQDPQKVATLIFDSGLSTANQVTEISGRGVGMGAVRRFIEDCGGLITLDLQLAPGQRDGYCPFQFVITLPSDLFEEPLYQDARRAA